MLSRNADGLPARFSGFGVVIVLLDDAIRIIEHLCCDLKRNAVLP